MKTIAFWLQIVGGVAAIVSAFLWWMAAIKQPMPFYQGGLYLGPPTDNSAWATKWRYASRLNAAAAFCTGVAAFLGGASMIFTAW
jgi:hypothetical protein